MRTNRRRPYGTGAASILFVSLLLAISCAAVFATKIGDIKKAPSSYDGKTVTVSGKVTGAHNLLVVKYFDVDDGTGEIPVVTQNELPKEGDAVRVKGTVNQAFVLGDARLVVIVEEPPKR